MEISIKERLILDYLMAMVKWNSKPPPFLFFSGKGTNYKGEWKNGLPHGYGEKR